MAKATLELKLPRFYWPSVALFAVLAATFFYLRPPILASLRALAFDAYQRAAPAPQLPNSPIQVVQIDEASLARLGQWPWPRTIMADLVSRLGEAGAAAIVFDIMFTEPDRTSPERVILSVPPLRRAILMRALGPTETHDQIFATALHNHPAVLAASLHGEASETVFPVVAGFAAAGDDPSRFVRNFPGVTADLDILLEAASGTGFINWLPDGDQVIRRVPMLLAHNGQIVPSLSLEALRVAVGASTYVVRSSNANGAEAFGAHTGIEGIKVGPVEIPTDAEGQVWVRFRRYDPDQAMPAWRVLEDDADLARFEGAIVLIGTSATGLMDLRATPLDASLPGVEVHRQVLEQIVSGEHLRRPDYAPGIELLTALLAVLSLALTAARLGPLLNAAIGAGLALSFWLAGFLVFSSAGYLFDPVFPTLAALVFSGAATTYFYQRTERQRAGIRRAFSQYVAPSVVRQLTAHPERLKLGGEVRNLTILLCDIRNFSTIAEQLSAEELTTFINKFLTPLSDIIIESGGTIDKYMGDAILAFWNAPLDQADHAERACGAALAIVSHMRVLNRAWRDEAEKAGRTFNDVRIGIGINTGECCVGNLGSERRFDYSAIGDAVNVASRLEGLTKIYGLSLLASEETQQRVANANFIEVDLVRLKGRSGATRVFTALADEEPPWPDAHRAFLDAFRRGDRVEAETALAALEAQGSLPQMISHYRQRLDAASMGETWDGVYDPDRK